MRYLALALILFLAACADEQFVQAPQVEATERIRTSFSSIEVREVSLPSYAAGEEIAISTGGTITFANAFWADDPTRAVTLSLARNLKEITGARVASEPWPFEAFPAARVDVRIEELVVRETTIELSGQYFVADQEGRGRDHAHLFNLDRPIAGLSAAEAGAGRAALIADLAREIAREAL
ncbi:MAG: ABC-type transport auxiliary lipoprotein family protein [Pseudomonadota bacterium]